MSRNNRLTEDNRFLISILNRIHQDNNQAILSITGSIRENDTNNDILNNLNESNNEIQTTIISILRESLYHNNIRIPTHRRENSPIRSNGRESNGRESNGRESNMNGRGRNNRLATNNDSYIVDSLLYTIPARNNNRNSNNTNPAINSNLTSLFQSFFNPIDVFPTQANIDIATRNIRFSEINSPTNNSCPITLERFNDNDQVLVIRHCGHIFSHSGLTSWFASNCRCPVCRYDIRNYSPNVPPLDISNNIVESNTSPRNDIISSISDSLINNYINDISGNNISNLSAFYRNYYI
jgi:hypothetical protein